MQNLFQEELLQENLVEREVPFSDKLVEEEE
jgi:hypothetical protein